MSERVQLSQIKEAVITSVNKQKRSDSYTVNRDIEDYESELPKMEGATFIDSLEAVVAADGTPSILDIGCGDGTMLLQLKEQYGDKIQATGVSAYDYRDKAQLPSYEEIDYRVEDAHRLRLLFPSASFDVIVSLRAMMYMGDYLRVLKASYHLLKKGGRAFINMPELGAVLIQDRDFSVQQYWLAKGIKANVIENWKDGNIGSVSIEKGESRNLPMPFSYTFDDILGLDYEINSDLQSP